MSRLVEIAGLLVIWLVCMALLLVLDLGWVVLIGLLGVSAWAIVTTGKRR
ncbi:MAG TPA: hypothetical protein VGP91_04310 [Actinoplanes sp.]|nr:hypothetical protein [Actinoplanes sp.]